MEGSIELKQGSVSEAEKAKSEIDSYFAELLLSEQYQEGSVFDLSRQVEDHLRQIAEKNKINLSQVVEIFFDNLITEFKKYPEAPSHLSALRENLFSVSPNLSNLLPADKMIRIGAKMTRAPELQRSLGSTINGELAYEMSYLRREHVEQLTEQLAEAASHDSLGEVVDQLDYLFNIAAQAAAQGSWAEAGADNSQQFLEAVATARPEPLVQLIAQAYLERSDQEIRDPSSSVLEYRGDPGSARIRVFTPEWQEEGRELRASLNFYPPLNNSDQVRYVAPGIIGIFDHAGALRGISEINKEDIPEQTEVSEQVIDQARDFAQRLVGDANYLFAALRLTRQCDSGIITRLNQEIPGDWEENYQIIEQFKELQAQARQEQSQIQLAAEEANQQASIDLINNFGNDQAKELLAQGYIEQAFNLTERLAPPEEVMKLRQFHSDSFRQAEEKITTTRQRIINDNQELLDRVNEIHQDLYEQRHKLQEVINAAADEAGARRQEKLPQAEVTPLPKVISSSKHNPYTHDPLQDTALLLNNLYSPDIQRIVQEDLGLSIREISFRSQIQLLQFLARGDQGSFYQFGQAYQREGINQADLMSSFFALSQDPEIGRQILDFAEAAEPDEVNIVLARYNEITKHVDSLESEVGEFFREKGREVDTRRVVQELVKRANRVLLTAIETGDYEALEQINADVVAFASLCRVTLKEGQDIALGDIAGFDRQVVSTAFLSQEQKQQMLEIAKRNYARFPEVWQELEKILEEAQDDYYILVKTIDDQQVVAAFARAYHLDGQRVYLGSLNVNQDLRGSGIGENFLQETIAQLAEEKTVVAVVRSGVQAGTNYIEEQGFIGVGYHEDVKTKNHNGLIDIETTREESLLGQRSKEDLITDQQENFPGNPLDHLGQDYILARFNTATQLEVIAQVNQELLNNQGYRLIRYFSLDPKGEERLYGFEKKVQSQTEAVAAA